MTWNIQVYNVCIPVGANIYNVNSNYTNANPELGLILKWYQINLDNTKKKPVMRNSNSIGANFDNNNYVSGTTIRLAYQVVMKDTK